MINMYTIYEVSMFTHYEDMKGDEKCKIGVVWGARDHPRSLETSPFGRAHMTSYSTFIETASILYLFRVIVRFPSKVANFNPPHLHLSPP